RKNSFLKTRALAGFFSSSSLRFLLRALLSLKGLREYSGYTVETKAIHLPSGDQMAVDASVAMVVNCFASPPPTSMTQSWLSPERVDSKRMCLPSGLQRGCPACLAAVVNCRGVPPLVGASQMLEVERLPFRSTVATT